MKPNHICKNTKCKREYYSCDYCSYTEKYLATTCSTECYYQYAKQWLDANPNVDLNKVNFALPIIIGKTEDETRSYVDELKLMSIDEVKENTKKELSESGYEEELKELGISGTVDLINKEIKEDASTRIRKHKKSK